MEVKIGVQFATRELSVDTGMTPDEVQAAVAAAFKSDMGIFTLTDEKGRRVVVPVSKLAYVEIAEQETRRVGFGGASL